MKVCEELNIARWEGWISPIDQERGIDALEHGRVLYFPSLSFDLEHGEQAFLSPAWSSESRKNISFDPGNRRLGGSAVRGGEPTILKLLCPVMQM